MTPISLNLALSQLILSALDDEKEAHRIVIELYEERIHSGRIFDERKYKELETFMNRITTSSRKWMFFLMAIQVPFPLIQKAVDLERIVDPDWMIQAIFFHPSLEILEFLYHKGCRLPAPFKAYLSNKSPEESSLISMKDWQINNLSKPSFFKCFAQNYEQAVIAFIFEKLI